MNSLTKLFPGTVGFDLLIQLIQGSTKHIDLLYVIGCEIGVWSSSFLFYLFDINNACAHIFFDCALMSTHGIQQF